MGTCLTIKAIHFELATSRSTDWLPLVLRSTNFKGAVNELPRIVGENANTSMNVM